MVVTEERKAVLTKPLSLEGEANDDNHKAPNIIRRVSSLFTNVRPGSDLTSFQVPATFNFPKSQLQCYGESVYCMGNEDLISKCNEHENSLERFKSVVAWCISTTRPVIFGVAPFNPILGETHHVSRGNLNVLAEQVSHHPPISALHATNEKDNIEIIWCHRIVPKFYGTSVETEINGSRKLKLLNRGEVYEMNSPKLLFKLFPVPNADWSGTVKIKCTETDFEAELNFRSTSFMGFGGNSRSIKGKILKSSSKRVISEISGHWNRTIIVKDSKNGEVTELFNAEKSITCLKTPIVKDSQGLEASESAVVWSKVSEAILNKDWEKANKAKRVIEEKQREKVGLKNNKRPSAATTASSTWTAKHFSVSYDKEDGVWDCLPVHKWVPQAPIIVPM